MGQTEIEVGRGVAEWTDRSRGRLGASWAFAIILFLFRDFKDWRTGLKYYSSSFSCVNGIGCSQILKSSAILSD